MSSHGFYHSNGLENENERKLKKNRQVLGPCLRAEKAVKHEDDGDIKWSWCSLNNSQGLRKTQAELEMRGGIKDRLDHSTVKTS